MVSGANLSSVMHYAKPTKEAESIIVPSPTVMDITPSHTPRVHRLELTELVYHIGRSAGNDQDHLLPWTPFQVKIVKDNVPVSTIAYNPILMAPPTDYSTVYTTLMRNKAIVNSLGQDHFPIVFDMGFLTKAMRICWTRPDELNGVIPMEYVLANDVDNWSQTFYKIKSYNTI